MCVCVCQIQKGKLHGCIDVGLSVMSIKKRARRIDLDTEEHIYHLKVCVCDLLDLYVRSLKCCGENQCFFNFRYFYVSGVYFNSFLSSVCYVKLMRSSCVVDAVNCLTPNSASASFSFKVKSPDVFDIWVCKLRHHRLFRQNEIVRSPRDATLRTFPPSAGAESPQNTPSSTHQNKVTTPLCLCFLMYEGLSDEIMFH